MDMKAMLDWWLHLLVVLASLLSEWIGIVSIPLGPGTLLLLPLFYAFLIGVLFNPHLIERMSAVIPKRVSDAASPLILISVLPFIAKFGSNIGPAIDQIIAAAPALLLQELGNLGTMLIALPVAVLVLIAAARSDRGLAARLPSPSGNRVRGAPHERSHRGAAARGDGPGGHAGARRYRCRRSRERGRWQGAEHCAQGGHRRAADQRGEQLRARLRASRKDARLRARRAHEHVARRGLGTGERDAEHLTRTADGIVVHLPTAKGDQEGDGATVPLAARPGSPWCPVAALDPWLDARARSPGPVFVALRGARHVRKPGETRLAAAWSSPRSSSMCPGSRHASNGESDHRRSERSWSFQLR